MTTLPNLTTPIREPILFLSFSNDVANTTVKVCVDNLKLYIVFIRGQLLYVI